MAVKRLRAGVAGAGWWANRSHLPALRADARVDVVALAERDGARARDTAAHWGVAAVHPDVDAMLDVEQLDLLVVSLPHALHHAATLAALRRGVHVMVEKPMALTAGDAWEMVRTARETGSHLVLGCTFQFTEQAALARQTLQEGRIGELQLVVGSFASTVTDFYAGAPVVRTDGFDTDLPNPTPSPDTYSDLRLAGGGQAWTQLSHLIGMLTWATERDGLRVSAAMADHGLPVDLVDAAWVTLDGGVLATIASTGGVDNSAARQDLIYYGTAGTMEQELGGRLRLSLSDGTHETWETGSSAEVYPREAAVRTLVDLALGVTQANPGDPVAGARATAIIEAAYLSARSGAVVEVAGSHAGVPR